MTLMNKNRVWSNFFKENELYVEGRWALIVSNVQLMFCKAYSEKSISVNMPNRVMSPISSVERVDFKLLNNVT